MSMSYTGAGEPAPAGGTTAGYVFYKAMFDHIFGQFNAALARMNTYLPAGNAAAVATPNATAGALAQRDTLAGLALGYLAVAPPAANASPLLNLSALAGHTGQLIAATTGGATKFSVDAAGNVVAGNNLSVTGATTLAGSLTAGNVVAGQTLAVSPVGGNAGLFRAATGDPAQFIFAVQNNAGTTNHFSVNEQGNGVFRGTATATQFVGPATGLTASASVPGKTIAEFALTPGAGAMQTQVAAGKWTDSNNTPLVFTGAIVTHAAAPAAPNSRWDAISLPPGATNTAVVTVGNDATLGHATDIGNPPTTRPGYPVGNTLVGYTLVPGGGGVIPAANVDDGWRNMLPGGGAAGGGGTGGAPTTGAYWVYGTPPAGLGNAVDSTLAQPTDFINLANLKSDSFGGSVADLADMYIQPDIPARLSASGTTVTLAAGTGGGGVTATPVTLVAYGASGVRVRTNVAAVATGAFPAGTGTKYLVATLPSGGSGFTLGWSAARPTVAYQVLLAIYPYDAALGALGPPSFSPIGTVGSSQIALRSEVAINTANDIGFVSTTGAAKPANMATATFQLAEPSALLVLHRAEGFWSDTAAASPRAIVGYAALDFVGGSGTLVAKVVEAPPAFASVATGAVQENWSREAFAFLPSVGAGTHTLTQVWQTTGAGASDLYTREVRAFVFAVGS